MFFSTLPFEMKLIKVPDFDVGNLDNFLAG
ncbi:hypothetical protein SAMN06265367_103230 [Algoriphagus winogradskyi]|uniref:Uncharacterized protein n=1 Tax=Algoriphagus winogradskyi TaxID=237017 RepID=A0ABY1NYB2_9BACT|nr:hypothetical protein SAMN06265367_103230 [Algoriphagus winogradskyi]